MSAPTFYLGTHKPHWLGIAQVPLFVSARRLREVKTLPRAVAPWALDSGGFTEISKYGRWLTPAMQYSSEVRGWRDRIGQMAFAATQDWMCEPHMVKLTGLSVEIHQQKTVRNYLLLRQLACDLPWLPVIQGWEYADYLRHVTMYRAEGVDLTRFPVVGLGSVCRRQDTRLAEDVIRELTNRGIKLHGFGFKIRGLANVAHLLASADSMAWSLTARREPPLPGHTHRSCANCLAYALAWRERVGKVIERRGVAMCQGELWR